MTAAVTSHGYVLLASEEPTPQLRIKEMMWEYTVSFYGCNTR